MKVIFLDFDGVINDWYTMNSINDENIKYLKMIVEQTGAKIVISSSKKYTFQANPNRKYEETICYKRYVKALLDNGIDVYDFTPCINQDRKLEIKQYLLEHPEIEEFLILDDDYYFEEFSEHQIFLDWNKGICEEHVVPAINILNGNLGFYPPDFDYNETPMQRIIRINKYYNRTK